MLFEKRFKSHHDSGGLISKYIPSERIDNNYFESILEEIPDNREKAIYVHTPFCDKICSFCNLNRKQLDGSLDEYANFIASEFDKYGKTRYFKESKFEVIFFGGGTPTVYRANQLEIILKSIQRNVNLTSDYEFTFETTLHNLTPEKLEVMKKYGVNRLSIGIQSFSDRGRLFYNRTFSKDEVKRRLRELKKNFLGDICIDIIYNFPSQEVEEVLEDARIIKELELSSASFYSLMVHDGSKLSKDIDSQKVVVEENIEKDYLLFRSFLSEVLKDDKYYLLELTKVAKKDGDNYKYIQVRNRGGDTFPIGNGAGGNVQGIGVFRMNKEMSFFSKQTDIHRKISRLSGIMQFPNFSKKSINEILSKEEYDWFFEKMVEYQSKGLLIIKEEIFTFTEKGIFWGNNIGAEVSAYLITKIFENRKQ